MSGSLCCDTAEEAKTLVPSLQDKISDDELQELLDEITKLMGYGNWAWVWDWAELGGGFSSRWLFWFRLDVLLYLLPVRYLDTLSQNPCLRLLHLRSSRALDWRPSRCTHSVTTPDRAESHDERKQMAFGQNERHGWEGIAWRAWNWMERDFSDYWRIGIFLNLPPFHFVSLFI